MKCEVVQSLLDRYLREELAAKQRAEIREHLKECPDCREALAFRRSLDVRMNSAMEAPESLRLRVEKRIAATAANPSWLTRVLGDPIMKKILISSTVATALVAGALLLAPGKANASTPIEAFNSMRAALAQAASAGEISIDLQGNSDGTVTVTGTLDGEPLPADFPLRVDSTRDGDFVTATVSIDFSPSNYSSIQFGEKPGTLEMVPKAQPNDKVIIGLDAKSMKPCSWTSLRKEGESWAVKSHHDYKVKPGAKPKKADLTPIRAKVKMYVGGHATVRISAG